MRLPKWLPKLNRKQKVVRNLVFTLLLLYLGGWINDFRAPTPNLALHWKVEEYALPAPELLYRSEKKNNGRNLVFCAGDFYGASREYRYGWFSYRISDVYWTKAEDGVALLPEMDSFRRDEFYVYSEYPEAVRADCELRMRHEVNVNTVHFDWDETYAMESQCNEKGLYRFRIQKKYGEEDSIGVRDTAEESVVRSFLRALEWGYGDIDAIFDVRITFYDAQGREVHTYEKTIEHARP